MNTEPTIAITYALMRRILDAFLEMRNQGAKCSDPLLMEALDKEMAEHDRRLPLRQWARHL